MSPPHRAELPPERGQWGAGGPPLCLAAAAGKQQDLLQDCWGAELQHPAGAGEHPAVPPHPPRATMGLQHPGRGVRAAPTPSPAVLGAPSKHWVHRSGGANGGKGPREGLLPVLVPAGGQPGAATAPPTPHPLSGLVASLSPSPVAALAHRGGGELEAWAGGGRCRLSADAAGARGVGDEPSAACVSRPAPAAECTTKTTIAPRPPPRHW